MLNRFVNDYREIPEKVEKGLGVLRQEYILANETEDILNDFEKEYRLLPEEIGKPYTFLRFLDKTYDEKSYSKILAYFMDPERPHGLGSAILDSFLSVIGFDKSSKSEDINIYTEYQLDNGRRADILIASESWIIIIENKVISLESQKQTRDLYLGIVRDKNFKGKEQKFIFLTPEGRQPMNKNFKPLKYSVLVRGIEEKIPHLLSETPVSTAIYLTDFIKTIKEDVMQEKMKREIFSQRALLYLKHYEEIENVKSAYDEDLKAFGERWPNSIIKEFSLNEDDWNYFNRTSHAAFYKNNWETANLFIHFEFWINLDDTGIMHESVPFMVDVEGKKKELFFKAFDRNRPKIEKLFRERKIEYRPSHRSVALAYKEYPMQGNPNNLPKVINQAFGEFRFLIEYIDNTLKK